MRVFKARIQKLRETEGTLLQLVESHMRIVSQVNSHLLVRPLGAPCC